MIQQGAEKELVEATGEGLKSYWEATKKKLVQKLKRKEAIAKNYLGRECVRSTLKVQNRKGEMIWQEVENDLVEGLKLQLGRNWNEFKMN